MEEWSFVLNVIYAKCRNAEYRGADASAAYCWVIVKVNSFSASKSWEICFQQYFETFSYLFEIWNQLWWCHDIQQNDTRMNDMLWCRIIVLGIITQNDVIR